MHSRNAILECSFNAIVQSGHPRRTLDDKPSENVIIIIAIINNKKTNYTHKKVLVVEDDNKKKKLEDRKTKTWYPPVYSLRCRHKTVKRKGRGEARPR